ncbi:MAG: class I SAM-dependent methyltransferase family protein [Methanosarcinaceae archaeon]|nr:class I SAM-dependent methyltransferase family protein [Methanosarcinaceae archaeon]MDD4332468.1 class I SAM-dependent methyltransferase family protein [Methanosarcinaceae archaeon]
MSLRDEMRGKVETFLLDLVPKHFDVIGDVAVIRLPKELEAYEKEIAVTLVSKRKNIKTVLKKVSKLEGKHRVAEFENLWGSSSKTLHRENGYIYELDVKSVFFNPRLYSERARVAARVLPSEKVLIPFAGIGPFVLPVAGKAAKVLALELNPEACAFLQKNLQRNRLEAKVSLLMADATTLPGLLKGGREKKENRILEPEKPGFEFDRAIVPTPYGLDNFLGKVSQCIKSGGFIHFYTFKPAEEIPALIKEYKNMGFEVDFFRRCGNVAPGISRWVFDLQKLA